jgi:hypothetical protein
MTWRIVNENSFAYLGDNSLEAGDVANPVTGGTGPPITWGSLLTEDLGIASAIVNLSNAKNNRPAWRTIIGAAYQNGSFAVASTIITPAVLNGSMASNLCDDILTALAAAQYILTYGSELAPWYTNWRSVLQGQTVVPATGCQIQIDDTKFQNGNNLPCPPGLQ